MCREDSRNVLGPDVTEPVPLINYQATRSLSADELKPQNRVCRSLRGSPSTACIRAGDGWGQPLGGLAGKPPQPVISVVAVSTPHKVTGAATLLCSWEPVCGSTPPALGGVSPISLER